MKWHNVSMIAKKELTTIFSSATAFIFLGGFLAVTLFVFFWVDTFFARNIADVRPIFEWMPVLLLFLVPSLTMRMWSEERRAGTLEFLLTSPLKDVELVAGKFVACLTMVAIALALTTPIPVAIGLIGLGSIDWGPVIGGYIASLFLAGAYASIGLYVSTKTDNQIVSLLFSMLLCGLFLFVGSDAVTGLFDNKVGEILTLIGFGSRFQSITRGIIDFRDLYYYVSIIGVFSCLNVLGLEKLRWAGNRANARHHKWLLTTELVILNLLVGNFWLQQVTWARADLTEGQIYSISNTTRTYLSRLQEPLLIRAYFSKKTHPLLAPLVPRIRDLLKEYAIAGKGKVRVEFIDPLENPELEKEAGEKYGIKPVVFQTASKYQAAVVNSYFDILIKYGDQYKVLTFRDLIEVKARSETDIDVDLRNPEYDITSAIKKVLYEYQGEGNLFSGVKEPIKFKGYISDDKNLPKPLLEFKTELKGILKDLEKESNGKFTSEFIDPEASGGQLAKKLQDEYGYRPMALGLFDKQTFWFYMAMESGKQTIQIPLADEIDKGALERSIKAGVKRFSKGFLKSVGIYIQAPAPNPMGQYGMDSGGGSKHFNLLTESLGNEHSVTTVSLDKGKVPSDIDLLVVIAPEKLDQKKLFAIDQFLMAGGTVILATAPYDVDFTKALSCRKIETGISQWLDHNGLAILDSMVLDPQNSEFPIPIEREIEGYKIQQTLMVPYPYFVDIRSNGMNQTSGLTAGVGQVTMNWSSPINLDKAKNKARNVVEILHSSKDAWTSNALEIQPQFEKYEGIGFKKGTDVGVKLLGVAVEGQFDSFFKGKPAPIPGQLVEKSRQSARIIVYPSNSFVSDEMLELASAKLGTQYRLPIQLIANSIDWSLEDRDLLAIRGRGHFARTLYPIPELFEVVFEYANYGIAILSLGVVWIVRRSYRLRARKRYQEILKGANV